MQEWVAAVERHAPGEVDDSVSRVRSWSRVDLIEISAHLPTLLRLIRDPDAIVYFFTPIEPLRPGANRDQIAYRPEEREALRRIARDAAAAGDGNSLLKRGAMLHADIALRKPRTSPGRAPIAAVRCC